MKSDKSNETPATSATLKKQEMTSEIYIAGKSICKTYLKTYLSGHKDEVLAVYAINTDDGPDLVFAKKDKICF